MAICFSDLFISFTFDSDNKLYIFVYLKLSIVFKVKKQNIQFAFKLSRTPESFLLIREPNTITAGKGHICTSRRNLNNEVFVLFYSKMLFSYFISIDLLSFITFICITSQLDLSIYYSKSTFLSL